MKEDLKNEVVKDMLLHRQRVSLKLSTIANDIAVRGRRHDNSYTEDTELELSIKLKKADNVEDIERISKILHNLHAKNNDYLPDFHNGDVSKMNMIQLLEFIADCVTKCDEELLGLNIEFDDNESVFGFYYKYIMDELPEISDDLLSIIKNTVDYMIDRNSVILKSLPKNSAEYGDNPILKGGLNYGA